MVVTARTMLCNSKVLSYCKEDMRFVFLFNKVKSEIFEKKYDITNLRNLFESVEETSGAEINLKLAKCKFPHDSLTYVLFKVEDDIVTAVEWH